MWKARQASISGNVQNEPTEGGMQGNSWPQKELATDEMREEAVFDNVTGVPPVQSTFEGEEIDELSVSSTS